MEEPEESESGVRIYRYTENQFNKFTPGIDNPEGIELISAHIEKHVGPIEMVFHEIVSDQVHVDVYWVKATSDRPFHVLVTSEHERQTDEHTSWDRSTTVP
ncbi:MAG: hypothetical protein QM762_07815 [Chryseolinea sp.]